MAGRKWKPGLVKAKKELIRSFARRKDGIMKKAHELSVLCGVQVGVVVFGPDKDTPHVWPQNLEKLRGIIKRFFNTSPDHRTNSRRVMGVSDFVKENDYELEEDHSDEEETIVDDKDEEKEGKITFYIDETDGFTVEELLDLAGKEEQETTVDKNKNTKSTCPVDEINGLSVPELFDLIGRLDAKLEVVNSRIDVMKRIYQNPIDVNFGDVLQYDQGMMNTMQLEELSPLPLPLPLPLPSNFQYTIDSPPDFCSSGSCHSDNQGFLNPSSYYSSSVKSYNSDIRGFLSPGSHYLSPMGSCNSDIQDYANRTTGVMGMKETDQSFGYSLAPWEKMLLMDTSCLV